MSIQPPRVSLPSLTLITISWFFTPVTLSLFCRWVHLCPFFLYSTYKQYCTCLSLSDLLHSVWQSLGAYMLLQRVLPHSFLRLGNTIVYICTTSSLSIPMMMNVKVASISWLLCIVLQWTLGSLYPFELWFPPDICPEVGLLDHITFHF